MRGNRLRKLAMFLAGWLAIIVFLGVANAEFYPVYYFLRANPQVPEGVCLTTAYRLSRGPRHYELTLHTDRNDCCQCVFGEHFCPSLGAAPQRVGPLSDVTCTPAQRCSMTSSIFYADRDVNDSFRILPGVGVRRGPFVLLQLRAHYFAGAHESFALVQLPSGSPEGTSGRVPAPRLHTVSVRLLKWPGPL
jgi:hypothetical protein